MYSLDDFGDMIADPGRMRAYEQAIARAVRPGDVAMDIGCGPGIFALLACKAGARRVYAIESGEVIQIAERLAKENGFSDRMQFFNGNSRHLELPERADVIISDIRGALPLFGQAVQSIEDARQRFLKPGGVMIPQKDTVYAALVSAEIPYQRITTPWRGAIRNLELEESLPFLLNDIYKVRLTADDLLSSPVKWAGLDYASGANARQDAKLCLRMERTGIARGICLWFEAQLFQDFGFRCAPGEKDSVYGQIFLPWLEPVSLEAGQEVHAEIHANPVGEDYVWRWDTAIPASNGRATHEFRQSTFEAASFSSPALRRRSADFVPELSEAGVAERWLLQAMDGRASLKEIAQQAAQKFPNVFCHWQEAFRRAAELAGKFSR